MAKDNLETNPITIKPKTASHAAEQLSWVPLPSFSPPRCPFPVKSMLCQHMCLLGQFISECYTRARFRALEGRDAHRSEKREPGSVMIHGKAVRGERMISVPRVTEVLEQNWLCPFLGNDKGFFDSSSSRINPREYPFSSL